MPEQKKTQKALELKIIQLWLTPKIGPVFIKNYLARSAQGDQEQFLQQSKLTLVHEAKAEALFVQCQQLGVSILTQADKNYPEPLAQIHAPPPVLFYKGTLPPNLGRAVSIVGARDATTYADQCLDWILPELLAKGVATISGGARGVDTGVARKTLTMGGRTVVVMGSGHNKPYPPENKNLFDEVLKSGGCVMSPFEPETGPAKENFPARNRVIAGLSMATIVIQAASKSGALITAGFARDEGREVFVTPGPINTPAFVGSNGLLLDGATPLLHADQVLQSLGLALSTKTTEAVAQSKELASKPKPDERATPDQKGSSAKSSSSAPIIILLNSAGKMGASAEEISATIGKNYDQVNDELFDLELEGLVQQWPDGLWRSK